MAKVGFGSEFKAKSPFDFPKLSLVAGEKARICVIDDPEMEFIHTLREVILVNGEPEMEQGEYKGRKYEKPKTDFKGKFVCLGDAEVLNKKGVDPDNCPACKASVENSSAVESPKRRYVVHVIKYSVRRGTFNLSDPFQVEVMAWEMAESRFNQLCDIQDVNGDLNKLDLILGPCKNAGFQLFEVGSGGPAAWLSSPEKKAATAEAFRNNKSDDLSPLLGRKVSATDLRAEVSNIVAVYNNAFGAAGDLAEAKADVPDAKFSDDLSSLLGGAEAASEPQEAKPAEDFSSEQGTEDKVEDLDSLLAGLK